MTLTEQMWFPSAEVGLPDREVAELRRELFIKRRKTVRQPPGVWQRFHTFRDTGDAARFCQRVNRGQHPVIRSRIGTFEALNLYNMVYLIYRPILQLPEA